MAIWGINSHDVMRYEQKGDIKRLIKALKYQKSSLVRKLASEVLGKIGNVQAVEPLIEALSDKAKEVRIEVAMALGKIKDPRAINPLIDLLTDRNKEIQKYAFNALSWIGSPAVEALVNALRSESAVRRSNAARSLAFMKDRDSNAIMPLLEATFDSAKEVRQTSEWALRRIGGEFIIKSLIEIGEPAVSIIIKSIRGPIHIHNLAPKTFKYCKDKHIIERLVFFLREANSDDYLFKGILKILENTGSQLPVLQLLSILKDDNTNDEVRGLILEALGKIGDKRAVEPLIDIIEDKNADDKLILEAVQVLEIIGDKRAFKPLIDLLQKEFPHLHPSIEIVRTLDKLNWKADKDEIKALYWIIKGEPNKCIEIGQNAREPIYKFIDHVLGNKKKELIEIITFIYVLEQLGDERAFEILISILKEGSDYDKSEAAKALDKLNWKPSSNTTGAVFYISTYKWDECVKMGDIAVKPLINALYKCNLGAAHPLGIILGKLGHKRMVPTIIKIIESKKEIIEKRKPDIYWRKERAYDEDWHAYHELFDQIKKMEEEIEGPLIEALQKITRKKFKYIQEWKKWWDDYKKKIKRYR